MRVHVLLLLPHITYIRTHNRAVVVTLAADSRGRVHGYRKKLFNIVVSLDLIARIIAQLAYPLVCVTDAL